MIIGIPKEVKDHEYRVGATPAVVRALVETGNKVLFQSGAGLRSGYPDALYTSVGAMIVPTAEEVYEAEMIIKVKEPIKQEYSLLRKDQILFCYLHLAPDPVLTKTLVDKGVVAIAYETVTDVEGRLPLLLPMSEIAGRVSIQVGATALQMINGGKGVLLGGVPGVQPAKVVIIGGGIAGTEAARMARGLEAHVTIIDKNLNRLRSLNMIFGSHIRTQFSTQTAIEDAVASADLVIGSVLIPGKSAPKLITEKMVQDMSPGSAFVDISIDQGGCSETSKPTTHTNPMYIMHDVVHYCVTNMPGACSRTATQALTHATMDYALKIANLGYKSALLRDPGLLQGLNVYKGVVTNEHVASDLGYDYVSPEKALNL
ncbi:MAG: alanine dehydrogenase [Chlamydiales bacterium]